LFQDTLRKRFDRLVERHGLPHMKFHMLRHIAGSLYIKETGSIQGAQKLLGHSKMSTTMTVYAHLFGDSIRADVERLNRAYASKVDDKVDDRLNYDPRSRRA